MRLLIECSFVYHHPHFNMGIQRVVRNIVSRIDKFQDIADIVPIIFKNDKIYEVKKIKPDSRIMLFVNLLHYRIGLYHKKRYWIYYRRIAAHGLFHASPNLRKVLLILLKLLSVFFNIIYHAVSCFCEKREVGKRIVEITIQSGDVLILLDSSWGISPYFIDKINDMKKRGIIIVSVIYDLIPLTHPSFCSDGHVRSFQHWFEWISQTADGFMTISKTIRDQLQSYICSSSSEVPGLHQRFDYFYLGSELDLVENDESVRSKVKTFFHNNRSVYLMVGTIEPRKNHGYLLDAFELLWQNGLNVMLCFVGKVGWKCSSLIKRVKTHDEYNRRLFMFNDLTDTELEYFYRESRCLVFPSFVEGFGLPLVEAMQRGLPAMVSDIPVFREVGGDFVAYFELTKPEYLAALISEFENSGEFSAVQKKRELPWLTWDDCTKQFLTKIKYHVVALRNNVSITRIVHPSINIDNK
ncbi:MAG: glycosyltransferase family 4 protein [Syntrophaceae bacterium]|nr:glycosyltransferase family 4 protein [Syntrophaceae bacterium]